jgi:hypothetical protein
MAPILDCLVSYLGLDENNQPSYRRYSCYHVIAGPGPSPGAGMATVTTLAIHDEAQRCTYCQKLHTVETGGPAAALAVAINYLDAYHELDHVRKVQSAVRGLSEDQLPAAVPFSPKISDPLEVSTSV